MNEKTTVASCAKQRYEIHLSDLPLSCPTAEMEAWDAHPKVYLDVKAKGEVACPYCGALYVLVDK
jgi:uncharacterized Zn-finger protein